MSTTQDQLDEIQQEIRNLQGAAVPDTLRRRLQELSTQLQATPRASFGRQPRQRNVPIITPTPPPAPLDPMEMPVWDMFTDYHTALCQYAGAANRDQWIHMMDIAADMTSATYGAFMPIPQPPSTGGPWGWNSDTQTWELVGPLMGRTDGTQPGPGEVGESVSVTGGNTGTPLSMTVGMPGNVTDIVVCTQVLQPGDWDLSGYITWDCRAATSTSLWEAWAAISETAPPPEVAIDGGSSIGVQAGFDLNATPIMTGAVVITVPTTFYLISRIISPNAADIGKKAGAWGALHARRMS